MVAIEKKKIKKDDIWVMRRCINAIDDLDIVARARVVAYLHAKYFNEALAEAQKRGAIGNAIPKAPTGPTENGTAN